MSYTPAVFSALVEENIEEADRQGLDADEIADILERHVELLRGQGYDAYDVNGTVDVPHALDDDRNLDDTPSIDRDDDVDDTLDIDRDDNIDDTVD